MVQKYRAPHLFPHFVGDWLIHKGISKSDLARKMNVDPANITRWIDEQERVTLDVLSGVALALDVHPADLLRPPHEAQALENARAAAASLLKAIPRGR